RRPGVDGDRNDPNAYYKLGVKMLDHSPTEAADAFYWAMKLDPGWADACYGRWVALQLANGVQFLVQSREGEWAAMSMTLPDIDSLMTRATRLNPFLYMKFDDILEERAFERATGGMFVPAAFSTAYTAGNFPRALHELAVAIPGYKYKFPVYTMRGHIFYMLGSYDSASKQLTLAREELEHLNTGKLLPVYISKATYDRSLGMVAEKQGN